MDLLPEADGLQQCMRKCDKQETWNRMFSAFPVEGAKVRLGSLLEASLSDNTVPETAGIHQIPVSLSKNCILSGQNGNFLTKKGFLIHLTCAR